MKDPNPCKYCGISGTHLQFACFKRPKKPVALKRTPIKRRGKHYYLWVETRDKWLEQNKASYYYCYLCNVQMTKSQLTLDHIKSRARHPELRYILNNLAPCCASCNSLKGSRDIDEL